MFLKHSLEIHLLDIFYVNRNISYKVFVVLHHKFYNFNALDQSNIGVMQILLEKTTLMSILDLDKANDQEGYADDGCD